MLAQEYKRLLYINGIKKIKHRNMYEYLNALDGLFIDMANLICLTNKDNVDKVLVDLPKTHNIWQQFSKRMRTRR